MAFQWKTGVPSGVTSASASTASAPTLTGSENMLSGAPRSCQAVMMQRAAAPTSAPGTDQKVTIAPGFQTMKSAVGPNVNPRDFQMSLTQNKFQTIARTPMPFGSGGGFGGVLTPAKPPTMQSPFIGGPMGPQTFYSGAAMMAPKKSQNSRTSMIKMGGAAELAEFRGKVSQMNQSIRITGAMRLVAAAKVRRAQSAVLQSRPFSETLAGLIVNLKSKLQFADVDNKFLEDRKIKNVALLVISGERGLCGSYNQRIINMTEERINELKAQGIGVKLVFAGRKAHEYFAKRDVEIEELYNFTDEIKADDARMVTDKLTSLFLSGEADKIEILYTNCRSLLSQEPAYRTILPLEPTGMENELDELFMISTKDGKLEVDVKKMESTEPALNADLIFEQEPGAIVDVVMPLYFNSQVLRALQESVASEMASRMVAMEAATDNAKKLKDEIEKKMNRARQALVTQEIAELVGAAEAQR